MEITVSFYNFTCYSSQHSISFVQFNSGKSSSKNVNKSETQHWKCCIIIVRPGFNSIFLIPKLIPIPLFSFFIIPIHILTPNF